MNILFLSLIKINSIKDRGIYSDLLREFANNGHNVSILSPIEKRDFKNNEIILENNSTIYQFKIGNVQKTKMIEKGISTLTLQNKFLKVIKRNLSKVTFDLVLYTTPPITLEKVVRYIKKRDSAKTYLLLKDIFPQNAIDIGLLTKSGLKGILYKYFRNKEKKLYDLSDYIGTMSESNSNYILEHNKIKSIVEVNPNSIEPYTIVQCNRTAILESYNIPTNKNIFIYGGNLGKPQGIDFLIQCILANEQSNKNIILIIGDGTEYTKLKKVFSDEKIKMSVLLRYLPKEEFDKILSISDVGLVFLDNRFTIPNYPSRILSYMNFGKPILATTDVATDIRDLIQNNNLGDWVESNDPKQFINAMEKMIVNKEIYSKNSQEYLKKCFNVKESYKIIINHFKGDKK